MHKIAVKQEGIERWRKSSVWLHLAAGCFLLVKTADYFQKAFYQQVALVLPLFLVALASLLYAFFKKRFASRYNRWVRLLQVVGFAVLALANLLQERALESALLLAWALICAFLGYSEQKTGRERRLELNEAGILIPGAFSDRTLEWSSINEVVARPDYLTIFQSNETYLQFEMAERLTASELEAINRYCQSNIQHKAGTSLA